MSKSQCMLMVQTNISCLNHVDSFWLQFYPSRNPWHGKCRWTPLRAGWVGWLLLSGNSASLPRFRQAWVCPPGKTWHLDRRLTASGLYPDQSWSSRPCFWWPKLNQKARATNSVFWNCLVPRRLSWVCEFVNRGQWTCSDFALVDHFSVFREHLSASRIPTVSKEMPVVHPMIFLPFNDHDASPRYRCGLPKTASLCRDQSPWNVTRLMLKRPGCSLEKYEKWH